MEEPRLSWVWALNCNGNYEVDPRPTLAEVIDFFFKSVNEVCKIIFLYSEVHRMSSTI